MSTKNLSQMDSSANDVILEVLSSDGNPSSAQPLETQVVECTPTEQQMKKIRKKKSAVWDYFVETTITIKGVVVSFWKCNYCGTKFKKVKSGTTSQLLRHIKDCEKIRAKGKCALNITDQSQTFINFMSSEVGAEFDIPYCYNSKTYDPMQIREIITKMIIVHEYPFMIVEHKWFNVLLKVLNPNYKRVSRVTVKNDCMKVFELEKEKLKVCLKDVHRISLTSDCWTSNQTIGYMCLTIHYIDDGWKLQKCIINFIELEPPHTGTFICDAICECLLDWNIQDKVSTITLDNASNNDVAANSLKANFHSRGKLHFKGYFFHVRCCAHILNIMVRDGLKEVQSIIYHIRETVKYLKKLPAQLYKFVDVAKQLGVSTKKGLCIDVPTRWNSTFLMLKSAFSYRCVFSQYAVRDNNYVWLPTDDEWAKYEKIRIFLGIFDKATKAISATLHPTSNIFLPTVMHVKKLLMEESISNDDYMRTMALAMKVKFNKYWGECNQLMSVAVVLDPRLKMKFIEFSFSKICNACDVENKIQHVSEVLWELYNEYALNFSSNNTTTYGSSSVVNENRQHPFFDCMLDFTDFVVSSGSIQPSKFDLQIYLEEGLYMCTTEHFDVLEWWRLSRPKFSCLSNLAKDVLTIPITTVASESAFSADGRVLDDYRSSLSIKTVNALVCAASWLRSSHQSIQTPLQDILEEENLYVKFPAA